MATVYLALGSNAGDSPAHITQAVKLLGASIQQIKQAPVYASKAVGYTDQADFLNSALSGQTGLSPAALLKFTTEVERQVGRTASFHWGPREIDIDIIFYDDIVMDTPRLVIPHPQFKARDFVLRPLRDLDPSLTDPVSGQTVAELLAKIDAKHTSLIKQVDVGN
jgi:2-amino-4-hydroxy-6-hydroxymethyldihydropteridine diphosphokinase